jgi:GT2 family glycosyltransferase
LFGRRGVGVSVRLSIVIVSYNTRDLLRECLESIFDYPVRSEFEVIVVDNGSTDGTIEMCAGKYPRVVMIQNEENRRWSGANNQGASAASGEYLFFLNSDTVVREGAIDAFVHFMDDYPEAALAGCRLHNADGTLQRSCRGFPGLLNLFSEAFFLYRLFPLSGIFGRYHMTNFAHDTVREVDMVTGAALMVRRPVYSGVGPFDESFHFYGEETDYCYRARARGHRTFFFPGAVIVHHGGGSPQPQQSYFDNLFNGLRHFLVKHHRGIPLSAMLAMHWVGAALRVPVYFLQGLFTGNAALFRKSLCYLKLLF